MRVYQFRHVGLLKDEQYSGTLLEVNHRLHRICIFIDLLCKHRRRPLH